MRLALLTVAGLVASAAALPNNYGDKKYEDGHQVSKYDDKNYDSKKYEEPKHDDKKYQEPKHEDKKYQEPKSDDKKSDDKKYDDKKEYDDGKKQALSAFPFEFTSTYYAKATPDEIVASDGSFVPGQPGASGHYAFGINSHEEVICFNITLMGVTGEYDSPANTATHIHEAAAGEFGPPRLAFPNPTGDDYKRTSFGCLKAPFITGVTNDAGVDTGSGFSLAQIEAAPAQFQADVHTSEFIAGAVRGQLMEK